MSSRNKKSSRKWEERTPRNLSGELGMVSLALGTALGQWPPLSLLLFVIWVRCSIPSQASYLSSLGTGFEYRAVSFLFHMLSLRRDPL